MIAISRPCIGEAEKTAVLEVLDSGMLAQGVRTARLEERFAEVCGVKHAVATSSGTTALHLALLANGIGPGDEVITTPFTFIASVNTILFTGARPVFADIDECTFNIDPGLVAKAISPRTKAIMPVHLYGQLCDMDALLAIAVRHGLKIIEDACQAVGATHDGRKAGSFGTGAFSLYATKNVMCGEGGMVTTNDDAVADRCRLLRNHGMRRRYYHEILGYNFRLTDLHAAIALAQLYRLEQFTEERRENAAYLSAEIRSVLTPRPMEDSAHVWHQYTVRIPEGRDEAAQKLNDAGIGTAIYYPVPAHRQPYVAATVGEIRLPVAERLAREVLSLPVHPLLTPDELTTIAREVNRL